MVIDANHPDYVNQTPEGQKNMRNGLCPNCSNSEFIIFTNFFGMKFWECTTLDCGFQANTAVFKPK